MKHLCLALAAGLLSTPALAATFTYDFEAAFDRRISSAADTTIVDTAAGFANLSGTITFDDTLQSTSGATATYGAPSLTLDQFSVAGLVPLEGTEIRNGPNFDQVAFDVQDLPPDGVFRDRLNIILRDGSESVFGSTDFPTLIDLADFGTAILLFTSSFSDGVNSGAQERVDFNFTSLTLRPTPAVPLPAGLPLLVCGLAGLSLLRKTR